MGSIDIETGQFPDIVDVLGLIVEDSRMPFVYIVQGTNVDFLMKPSATSTFEPNMGSIPVMLRFSSTRP